MCACVVEASLLSSCPFFSFFLSLLSLSKPIEALVRRLLLSDPRARPFLPRSRSEPRVLPPHMAHMMAHGAAKPHTPTSTSTATHATHHTPHAHSAGPLPFAPYAGAGSPQPGDGAQVSVRV